MDKLVLGIKGRAVCVSKSSGERLWSTKLKNTSGITNVFLDADKVFAYSGGHLFCLDLQTGSILWENALKGLGYGPCIMAGDAQSSAVNAAAAAAAVQQASVAYSSSGDGDGGGDGGGD